LGHLDPDGAAASTSRRRGTSAISVISRFVQAPGRSRRPGTGGTIGDEPVASTMCSASWTAPSTSTRPEPAIRPVPRISSMPLSSSQETWPESSQPATIQSRKARAAGTSSSPLTASRAPGTRRAAARASPGRRRVLLGMQAQ
jgi:hypothetical protein